MATAPSLKKVLLDWHVTRCGIIAQEEKDCETLEEILVVFLAFKEDLLFHRQLRVHRATPDFEACLDQTTTLLIPAFLLLWMKLLDLPSQSYLAKMILKLSVDNFFLQITPENFQVSWLNNYFKTLIATLRALRESYPMNKSRNKSL